MVFFNRVIWFSWCSRGRWSRPSRRRKTVRSLAESCSPSRACMRTGKECRPTWSPRRQWIVRAAWSMSPSPKTTWWAGTSSKTPTRPSSRWRCHDPWKKRCRIIYDPDEVCSLDEKFTSNWVCGWIYIFYLSVFWLFYLHIWSWDLKTKFEE